MAGIRNTQTLRDLPNAPTDTPTEEASNPFAQYVDSLSETRRGRGLNPKDPKDILLIQQVVDGTMQGLLGDAQIKKLMGRNPIAAPIFASALANQKLYKDKTGNIKSILTDAYSPEGNNISGPEDDQTVTYRPEAFNYSRAIARLTAAGETEKADKLSEQWKRVTEATQGKQQGLYGGVQYAFDPKTQQYVPYSVDEKTRQSVRITAPEGTVPTVPVIPTPGVGPQGPGFYPQPTRAPASGPPQAAPGVTPMPTSEEAKSVGQAENAQEMAARLKAYVNNKQVEVGPAVGRWLRAKATLPGQKLTEQEADVLSIEQQLSNQLLQAMRGAQVGPAEQDRFDKQLPRIDQNEEVFKANIKNTMRNLEGLQKRMASQRPIKLGESKSPEKRGNEVDFSSLPKKRK